MAVRSNNGGSKRQCPFTAGKISEDSIDYKNHRFLKKYVSEGRIVPSRITGLRSVVQRRLEREVKYARFLALLPYCDRH